MERWGGALPRARPFWAEDMAGLGSPAEFRQLPKYADGRVDSRSRHVPRACTKENTECFLDDTVFVQSHAFLREGGEEGVEAVCRGGGSALAPSILSADVGPRAVPAAKGVCWMHCRAAVPRAHSCVPALTGSQQTPALCTGRMPCFSCFLPWALGSYLCLPHMDMAWPCPHCP